ncbi:hypothetical protein [Sulfurovum mangrovi]|uniref:hypothetical protein n=1 Tax=Sulfurovum mangrovi TaxID=2893889 RepID=UPI001E5DFAB7|nr:hypothetical protein [Sulfurovum mangrovi]UFH59851.1 hypothetical protein LN246_03160 [Sulfurovum mangrovi]UFH59902.1 hypothetical protein LN246_03420 [Sulfurovum mangrovi]
MRLLLSISAIFILSGCGQPVPKCPEPVCKYPTLPTYKLPSSRTFAPVKQIDNNVSIFKNADIIELVENNVRLRRICTNYAVINKRVNKEYQK